MNKAVYQVPSSCIDEENQRVFLPFLSCYDVHSIMMHVNGQTTGEFNAFDIKGEYLEWVPGGYTIDGNMGLTIEVYYFYKDNSATPLDCVINNQDYDQPDKIKEIINSHYVDAQYALDSGLYKNSVLNFGVSLECLLSTVDLIKLSKTTGKRSDGKSRRGSFYDLVDCSSRSDEIKEKMHFIRNMRNKVHPAVIIESKEVTRKDAIDCRNNFEIILNDWRI